MPKTRTCTTCMCRRAQRVPTTQVFRAFFHQVHLPRYWHSATHCASAHLLFSPGEFYSRGSQYLVSMPLFVYGNGFAESSLRSANKAQGICKLPAGSSFEVVLRLLTLFINVQHSSISRCTTPAVVNAEPQLSSRTHNGYHSFKREMTATCELLQFSAP
jgi:hypothetical protein